MASSWGSPARKSQASSPDRSRSRWDRSKNAWTGWNSPPSSEMRRETASMETQCRRWARILSASESEYFSRSEHCGIGEMGRDRRDGGLDAHDAVCFIRTESSESRRLAGQRTMRAKELQRRYYAATAARYDEM